ncbi:MAG: hypothetical protein ACIAQZ_15810 [Sedimentisphaeraceae bacterium JB056]
MSKICASIIFVCGVALAATVTNCSEVWANGYGLKGDINKDCVVDITDIDFLLSDWLKCNDPSLGCSDISNVNSVKNILTDEDSSTYITVTSDWQTFYYDQGNAELINLRVDIDADSAGSLEVELDDVMVLAIDYDAGENEYSLRLPYSKTNNIKLRSLNQDIAIPELYLEKRTGVSIDWPTTGVESSSVTVTVESDSTASSTIPFGVMCNWFSRGVVEGITDSDTKTELISKFGELGVSAWRYPGGTMTYGYPPTQQAIQVYKDAGMGQYAYGLNKEPLYWSSPEDFFAFCKDAGITAWYEINPGFWYDSVNKQVLKTVPMDGRGDIMAADNLDAAVADAVAMAQYADSLGVDVVWEIGNEDYVYYTAETYANLCQAFINGIRAVLPDAKFAACGDGYSWSDHSFADAFKEAMSAKTITGILDYSSEHLYLSGVGYTDSTGWHEFDWYTPSGHGDAAVAAWPIIRPQYFNSMSDWADVGYTDTKLAMTEFNTRGIKDIVAETEHSVGRALGEAVTVVNMLNEGTSCIFTHDLVRSSPDATFYARLDYYPENSAGRKYFMYPEARTVGLTSLHGKGNILYNSGGITVSRHSDFVYLTVVNRDDVYKATTFYLSGISFQEGVSADVSEFRAAAEECCFFDYYYQESQTDISSSAVNVKSYPFSVKAYKIYVN